MTAEENRSDDPLPILRIRSRTGSFRDQEAVKAAREARRRGYRGFLPLGPDYWFFSPAGTLYCLQSSGIIVRDLRR